METNFMSRRHATFRIIALWTWAALIACNQHAASQDKKADLVDTVKILCKIREKEVFSAYSISKARSVGGLDIEKASAAIGVKEAIAAARRLISGKFSNTSMWKVYSCTLQRVSEDSHWIWVVTFAPDDFDDIKTEMLDVHVYLDGTTGTILTE